MFSGSFLKIGLGEKVGNVTLWEYANETITAYNFVAENF